MKAKILFITATLLATTCLATAQTAVMTGGKGGFYYAAGGALAQQLGFPFNYAAVESGGTLDNIKGVVTDPHVIGFAQGDVLASEIAKNPALVDQLEVFPLTGLNECIFAAVKSNQPVSLGTFAKYGATITFFVPKGSGSLATLQILQGLQPQGIGLSKVSQVDTVEDAIQQAMRTTGGVAFFVQLADPDNSQFKGLRDAGAQLVPIASKTLETLKVGGTNVYTVQPTEVEGIELVPQSNGQPPRKQNVQLTTTCTTMAVITGKANRFPAGTADSQTQTGLVAELKAVKPDSLIPKAGIWAGVSRWINKAKALSGNALDAVYQKAGQVL